MHNSKHWSRIGFPEGMSDANVPWDARFFSGPKQALPPPSPPAADPELIEREKELEKREAQAALAEAERKKNEAGTAAAELNAKSAGQLQGQFRSPGRRRAGRDEGGGQTGLRL